jgi:peroxiredoxin
MTMANPLTGDYEAVVQIAIRQINGLIGTLHQNTTEDSALKLLHSSTLRIGYPRRRPPRHVEGAFADWLLTQQKARSGRGLDDIRADLTGKAPPGAVGALSEALAEFDKGLDIQLPPDVVRGMAKVQVSSVTISIPEGSSSEVTLHARIRAHYYPDPGTTDLPAPVHGDLQATLDVRVVQSPLGRQLVIQPSSDDAKIQFIAAPGTGLTAIDQGRIAAEVRKALRDMRMLPVRLPANFPFTTFKGMGSGPSQAIALGLQLSGAGAPANGLQSLTQSSIGSSGFSFAVNEAYVTGLIDTNKIREDLRTSPPIRKFGADYYLSFRIGSPTLTFKAGGIEISGTVDAKADRRPDIWVEFKQLVTLALDGPSQTVRPVRLGEPDVDESLIMSHSQAVNIVKAEIDKALAANAGTIETTFTDARTSLINALKSFDTSASSAYYSAIEITPHGVIIRGDVGSVPWWRRVPVVDIAETHQGVAFTAFQSWIPAGRIDRFIWSWIEQRPGLHAITGLGTVRTFTDEHRFILPKPADATAISQVCLRIEGTQLSVDGRYENSAAGGTTCQVQEPEIALDVPPWWEPLTLPIWRPELADSTTLKDAIAGHVSIQGNLPGSQPVSKNTLVYFADWRPDSQKPLEALSSALSRVRNSSALMVIVVLPEGAFDSSRRDFESKLPAAREGGPSVHFTEDSEGGWTRTFAVAKRPSAYLINAKGEFVWKHEGEPDAGELAAAVDRCPVPRSQSRFRPLRLPVSPGDSAPDAHTEEDDRHQFALHRFRGHDVVMNFWQWWSAPCLAELTRLQRLHEAEKEPPFIVAFHGGRNSDALDEIRKHLGLSFLLAEDPNQRMASRYGVRCWPTTIMVDAQGRVEHVQLGTGHGHEPRSVRQKSEPAGSRS